MSRAGTEKIYSSGDSEHSVPPPMVLPPSVKEEQGKEQSSSRQIGERIMSNESFQKFLQQEHPSSSTLKLGKSHDQSSDRLNTFDKNEGNGDAPSLLQPILSPSPTQVMSPSGAHTPSQGHPTPNETRVTLNDVKAANPLECEAEAAILKAIEEHHKDRNPRNKHRPLLSGVPDEAIHLFHPEEEAFDEQDGTTSIRSIDPETASSQQRSTLPTSSSQSFRTAQSSPSRMAGSEASVASQRQLKQKGHKKKVSVETTLFDIAEEMEGIHGVVAPMNDSPTGESEDGIGDPLLPQNAQDPPRTHHDHFVKNARILFRRSGKRKMDQDADTESDDSSRNQDTSGELEVEMGGVDDSDQGKKSQKSVWKRGMEPLKAIASPVTKGAKRVKHMAMEDIGFARDFLKPRKMSAFQLCKMATKWIFFPTLIVSFALYYAGNPLVCSNGCASFSWWFIFIFIRQVITFSLALAWEVFVIDFLSLRNRATVRVLGPVMTLLIVQSKGWPFRLLMWSVMDFALLFGGGRFANHWLFYQNLIPVFNAKNPSGNVLQDDLYFSILVCGLIVSISVGVKRLWMGVYLGKRTYANYGKQLTKVMNDMVLLGLLANLGHELELVDRGMAIDTPKQYLAETIFKWDMQSDDGDADDEDLDPPISAGQIPKSPRSNDGLSTGEPQSVGSIEQPEESDRGKVQSERGGASKARPKMPVPSSARRALMKCRSSTSVTRRTQINQLLGKWTEPNRVEVDDMDDITISAILQFRQALSYMDDDYPFSVLFGPAGTRELCIESSQKLYDRLLLQNPGVDELPFETIALICEDKNGEHDERKLKRLYRLFHPDREGNLGVLDFVRSCDDVYKRLRLLRAAIANSSQIDRAFERMFNTGFYVILACVVLSQLGFDPLALFLSLSSIIVAFAFMIGSASAKYFEGILFILLRKPFDIGDRIHASDPISDTNSDGSAAWLVENVDLYSTTVRFAATNEVATVSNGSLASARIINGARSPEAQVFIYLKFGVDVDFSKIQVFQTTVESFVKARPREWLALGAFRAVRVEANQGFVEYVLVLQHKASWQDIGAILTSKAALASYCLEVSKKLDMNYTSPPLPVNLEIKGQQVPVLGADRSAPVPSLN